MAAEAPRYSRPVGIPAAVPVSLRMGLKYVSRAFTYPKRAVLWPKGPAYGPRRLGSPLALIARPPPLPPPPLCRGEEQ